MKQVNIKFRGNLFGGFRRKDVAEYVGKLAGEKESVSRENEKLKEKISALEKKIDSLTREQEKKTAAAEAASPEPKIPEVVKEEIKTAPEQDTGALEELEKNFLSVKANIDVSTAHIKCELRRMEEQLCALQQSMEKTEERILSLRKSR